MKILIDLINAVTELIMVLLRASFKVAMGMCAVIMILMLGERLYRCRNIHTEKEKELEYELYEDDDRDETQKLSNQIDMLKTLKRMWLEHDR